MRDILDITTLAAAATLSGYLIVRYRAVGTLISIPFAWAILCLCLLWNGSETWQDQEFAEDWPGSSVILVLLWCFVVNGAAWAVRRFLKGSCPKPPNQSVEPNRRPASPLDTGRQSESASCAPPSRSAAVAHLWRYAASAL